MRIALSKTPTRAELRDALTVLRAFAAIGDDEAAEQHAQISEMIRALYPRVLPAGDTPDGRPRRRRSKRRLIEAEDTLRTCPQCDGAGKLRYSYTRPVVHLDLTPEPAPIGRASKRDINGPLPAPRGGWHPGPAMLRHGDERPPALVYGEAGIVREPEVCGKTETSIGNGPCWRCAGEGTISDMAHEHDPRHTLLNGRRCRREKPIRGEWALQTGVSGATARGVHHVHERGFVGGRPVGVETADETEEARRWYGAGTPEPYYDAIDISAALEGRAIRRIRGEFHAPSSETAIRGRQLAKRSRRDPGVLTPRQQKRVRQEDRARSLNRGLARHRPDLPARRRGVASWVKELALSAGVDLDALTADSGAVVEDGHIVQAIRRGDLPPDPVIEPDPDMDGASAPVWDAIHAGKRAIRRCSVGRAVVTRADGTVFWCDDAVMLTYSDGSVETYAPADLDA